MNAALVVMAAGLGSRYGGVKQIAGVGPAGEILMEYAIYDAIEAGFDRVILVVKQELIEDIKRLCGNRLSKLVDVKYAVQDHSDLPAFSKVNGGRTKPLGTVHAVLAAAPYIDRPFAVVNADDYYGKTAFRKMADSLASMPVEGCASMVGYRLKNTVSLYGGVTRGVCRGENGRLETITETYNIRAFSDGSIRDGNDEEMNPGTLVSMNFWSFTPWILKPMRAYFHAFLRALPAEDNKTECLLPLMMDDFIRSGLVDVDVLETEDAWFGMTFKDDREKTTQALQKLHEAGEYPPSLR